MHVGFPAASATEQGGSQRIHRSFSGILEAMHSMMLSNWTSLNSAGDQGD